MFESLLANQAAGKILPKELPNYNTTTKPSKMGEFYNADVLEEAGQKIRENLTSFTDTAILPNQTKPSLRSALITLLSRMKVGPSCHVRVDNQSSLSSLRKDKSLEPYVTAQVQMNMPCVYNQNKPFRCCQTDGNREHDMMHLNM